VSPNCPLCRSDQVEFFLQVKKPLKDFWHCYGCDLVFLSPRQRLQEEEERARYLTHNNNPQDPRYKKYLSLMMEEIWKDGRISLKLLDYGCGPTNGIEILWGSESLQVTSYDPFFFPVDVRSNGPYDYILCCESAEHFCCPQKEWQQMAFNLKPKAKVIMRTGWRPERVKEFARWGYHNDPTHVCFYSAKTLEWITSQFGIQVHSVGL